MILIDVDNIKVGAIMMPGRGTIVGAEITLSDSLNIELDIELTKALHAQLGELLHGMQMYMPPNILVLEQIHEHC